MLPIFVGIIATCAIGAGFLLILSRAEPSMRRNKVCRFVILLVLFVPLNFVINYVNVSFLGYHKMGWTGEFLIALLVATCGTFWPPQPRNSNTP
jgi:hypothetical protein